MGFLTTPPVLSPCTTADLSHRMVATILYMATPWLADQDSGSLFGCLPRHVAFQCLPVCRCHLGFAACANNNCGTCKQLNEASRDGDESIFERHSACNMGCGSANFPVQEVQRMSMCPKLLRLLPRGPRRDRCRGRGGSSARREWSRTLQSSVCSQCTRRQGHLSCFTLSLGVVRFFFWQRRIASNFGTCMSHPPPSLHGVEDTCAPGCGGGPQRHHRLTCFGRGHSPFLSF